MVQLGTIGPPGALVPKIAAVVFKRENDLVEMIKLTVKEMSSPVVVQTSRFSDAKKKIATRECAIQKTFNKLQENGIINATYRETLMFGLSTIVLLI